LNPHDKNYLTNVDAQKIQIRLHKEVFDCTRQYSTAHGSIRLHKAVFDCTSS